MDSEMAPVSHWGNLTAVIVSLRNSLIPHLRLLRRLRRLRRGVSEFRSETITSVRLPQCSINEMLMSSPILFLDSNDFQNKKKEQRMKY